MKDLRRIDREVEKVENWLNWSKKGEKMTYYKGFLAGDMKDKDRAKVRLAQRIQELTNQYYESKVITLTQRKVEEGKYEYIAIRT